MSHTTSPLEKFESRLYPNKSSQVGFLAPGQKLMDVINSDREYLARRNITCTQIGNILDRITHRFQQRNMITDDKFEVIDSISFMGYQDCPFESLDKESHGCIGSCDITVKNLRSGKTLFFPALAGHLIREHGFFQGPGTHYRVEPADVIEVFEIQPGVVYDIPSAIVSKWGTRGSGSQCMNPDYINSLKMFALDIFAHQDFIAMIFPTNRNWLCWETTFPNESNPQELWDSLIRASELRNHEYNKDWDRQCGTKYTKLLEHVESEIIAQQKIDRDQVSKYRNQTYDQKLCVMVYKIPMMASESYGMTIRKNNRKWDLEIPLLNISTSLYDDGYTILTLLNVTRFL